MTPSLEQLSAEFNRLFPLVQAPPPPPPPPKPAAAKPAAPKPAASAAVGPDLGRGPSSPAAEPGASDGAAPVPKPAPARPAPAKPAAAESPALAPAPSRSGEATAAPTPTSAAVGPDLGRGPTGSAGELGHEQARALPAEAAPAAAKPAPTPRPAAAAAAAKPAAPATPPAPPAPPVMVPPSKLTDRSFTGYDLDTTVPAADIVRAVEIVDQAGFTLDCITGVDWIDQKEMEVVYDFFHTDNGRRIVLRARIPRAKPEIATISHLYAGASWHERETHDFFGIVFVGHPHLVPILLEDDATYHPLRKDYSGAAPFER